MSDPTLSDIEFRHKMTWLCTALNHRPILKLFLVAYEQPGPKEIAILENPFDLAAEGIKVSNAELQAASKMNFKNVKVDMDA